MLIRTRSTCAFSQAVWTAKAVTISNHGLSRGPLHTVRVRTKRKFGRQRPSRKVAFSTIGFAIIDRLKLISSHPSPLAPL